MIEAEPELLASRRARIAAACVNLAPALVPLVPMTATWMSDNEPTYGVLGYYAWSFGALLLVILANTVLLLWRQQSLGLAYLGLAYRGPSAARMLLGKGVVWLLPWFTIPSIAVPLAFVANWLVWLWPGRRTLADRVGQCRVVERHDYRDPPLLLELLMVGPIVLFLPMYAQLRGGALGAALALLLVGAVIAWRRLQRW
jgi:hypothetical protein